MPNYGLERLLLNIIVLYSRGVFSMFTVFLLDDEPCSLKGIYEIFPWDDYDMDVIGQSLNSMEGLEEILEKKPDVVFTDIRMPELTGIELMKKVKEVREDTEFVLVSGFAEFEYAKNALNLGAFDYILKPLQTEETDKVIKKLFVHLDNKRIVRDTEIFEDMATQGKSIYQVFNDAHKRIKEKYYQPFLFYFDKEGMYKRVKDYISKLTDSIYELKPGKDVYFFILNTGSALEKDIENEFQSALGFWAGIGRTHEGDEEISVLIRESFYGASDRFIYKTQGFYPYKGRNPHIIATKLDQLKCFIKKRMYSKLIEETKILPSFFIENNLGMEDLEQLWNQLAAKFNQNKAFEETDINYMDCFQLMNRFETIQSMFNYIKETVEEVVKMKEQHDLSHIQANINFKDLLAYINDHYKEEIVLKELAGRFHINHTYCSELFRKYVGITFNKYLTSLRMKMARSLLDESSLSVDDVCYKVGYKDYFHFIKVFKKFYGITPSKYKKR